MYRVQLTEAQQDELHRRTRLPGLKPRTRDRLEMVRLVDAGFSIPRVSRIVHQSEGRVRHWLKRFIFEGFDALEDLPHVGQSSRFTPELFAALRAEVEKQERTWTATQLADWLAEHHGLRLTPNHLGRLLRRNGFSYRRTERHLRHKQDPELIAAKQAELAALEKGAPTGAGTSPM